MKSPALVTGAQGILPSWHRYDPLPNEATQSPGLGWLLARMKAPAQSLGQDPKGNAHLKALLVQAAHTVARSNDNYLGAQFRRILLVVAKSALP